MSLQIIFYIILTITLLTGSDNEEKRFQRDIQEQNNSGKKQEFDDKSNVLFVLNVPHTYSSDVVFYLLMIY